MQLKNLSHIVVVVLISWLVSGCKEDIPKDSQGTITYKVTYPKMDENDFMLDFMPKEMVMKFTEGKLSTTLTAGMGMFRTKFISNRERNEYSQMVKLINKKYILTLQGDGIAESLANLPKFHIEETGETKKILDYVCHKAIITIDNESHDAFTIYYTKKINISNPNWNNQFKEVDGIMLEYQYEKYGVCMKFEAKSIKFEKIEDHEFEPEEGYEPLTEAEMDNEMLEIFKGFE